MSTRFHVLAVIAALSAAQARAADEPAPYLVAAQDGTPVTTASGACVRTTQWSAEASYRDCNPLPTAKLVAQTSIEPAAIELRSPAAPIPRHSTRRNTT